MSKALNHIVKVIACNKSHTAPSVLLHSRVASRYDLVRVIMF